MRHAGWYPELHFAFRPGPDEPIGDYDFDSIYATDDEHATDIYQDMIISRTVTWDDKRYDLVWVEGAEETQRIIDQHFWEYEDHLSKPE